MIIWLSIDTFSLYLNTNLNFFVISIYIYTFVYVIGLIYIWMKIYSVVRAIYIYLEHRKKICWIYCRLTWCTAEPSLNLIVMLYLTLVWKHVAICHLLLLYIKLHPIKFYDIVGIRIEETIKPKLLIRSVIQTF